MKKMSVLLASLLESPADVPLERDVSTRRSKLLERGEALLPAL